MSGHPVKTCAHLAQCLSLKPLQHPMPEPKRYQGCRIKPFYPRCKGKCELYEKRKTEGTNS